MTQMPIDLVRERFPQESIPEDTPIVVAFGAGTNSSALLIAMWLKGIVPDAILFADTGGEREETYRFIEVFSQWLESVGFPPVTVVRHKMTGTRPRRRGKVAIELGKLYRPDVLALPIGFISWAIAVHHERQTRQYQTLLEECLTKSTLPGKAYGNSNCSHKWKVAPQQKYIRARYGDRPVQTWVGIHYGETQRLLKKDGGFKPFETDQGWDCYPLCYWGLTQAHCQALIRQFSPEPVVRSACWFCPNAKTAEIRELKQTNPDLYQLGVDMEKLAQAAGSGKGLGRSFNWGDIDKMPEYQQLALDLEADNRSCGCLD